MTTKKPTDTLRDGALRATIWRREGQTGPFYSVNFTRTYTDAEGAFHDADSFSGAELLRVAHLATRAYQRVSELRQADRDAA